MCFHIFLQFKFFNRKKSSEEGFKYALGGEKEEDICLLICLHRGLSYNTDYLLLLFAQWTARFISAILFLAKAAGYTTVFKLNLFTQVAPYSAVYSE